MITLGAIPLATARSTSDPFQVECFRGRLSIDNVPSIVVSITAREGPELDALDRLPGTRLEAALKLLLPEIRALLELLDHLDTVWRLQEGQGRLLRPGSLSQVALVLGEVTTFTDYRAAVNDLVQLLNRAVPSGGSNGRHLADMVDIVAEFSPAGANAVESIRSVVNFRSKLEHKPREQTEAALAAGLQFGSVSWPEAWQSVIDVVADALRVLVAAIKDHVND